MLVASHPNFAYLRLWHISWVLLAWLALLYAASLALLHRFLRMILRPLQEIETVANAISDSRFLCHISDVANFVARPRQTGARFAIDNFGLHRQAFDYLQKLQPDYIKLNAALIGDLAHDLENQLFISSVAKICRALDVMSVVNGAETGDLLPMLKNLGVDGYRGYASARPVRIDDNRLRSVDAAARSKQTVKRRRGGKLNSALSWPP